MVSCTAPDTSKISWVLKLQKPISELFMQEQLYLVSGGCWEILPSFAHYLPVNCERRALGVFAFVGVCVWATLSPVIYSPSRTLPFCLLVNCHGEGGLQWPATENHKSGHFLPLSPTSRGEACPVANTINPLPLRTHTHTHLQLLPSHPPTRGHAEGGGKKNRTSFTPPRQRNRPDLPSLPYTGNN